MIPSDRAKNHRQNSDESQALQTEDPHHNCMCVWRGQKPDHRVILELCWALCSMGGCGLEASKHFGSYQERNAAVVETLTVTMECCSVQSTPKKGCGRVRKAQGREPWQQAQRAPAQEETRRFPLEMSEGQETSIHYFSPSRRPRGNKLNQGTAGLKQTKGATPPRRPLVKLWAILLRDVLKKDHAASARRWYGAF